MYEIFERLLKERGVKAFDVAKATGLRSSLFTDWKMGRYKPKAEKRRIITTTTFAFYEVRKQKKPLSEN